MIGADFEKIHFVLFGLNLVEPMAFITDVIMGSISIFFGIKVSKMHAVHPFYQYWKGFFLIFGVGSILGGFGHLMYNYWGIPGKLLSWLSGPLSVYCLEQAMISIFPDRKIFRKLKIISFWKLITVITIWILLLAFVDLSEKPSRGFLPIAINTIVGVSLTAGILGKIYVKKGLSPFYKYFYFGVLVMIPSAFIFLLKINLNQWFDKNDLSHVLLTIGIVYFFLGVKRLSAAGFHQDNYL